MNLLKYVNQYNTGLVNLGNTCFLNSCVQILNHTFELIELLESKQTENNLKVISDANIIKEWYDLRKVMWNNNGTVSPNKFVYNVQQLAKEKNRELFTGWAQNDMPEFLLFIVDCIHNSISRKINMRIKGTPQNNLDVLAVTCYSMLKNIYSKEYSEIMEMFYGIYVSEIISLDETVKHVITPENYFILDLPIDLYNNQNDNRILTIYDSFNLFTKPEILDGENAWFNEKTNKKENIKKRIQFWNLPTILVITFKRFSHTGTHKINEFIDFPINNLDLSKYVCGYNPNNYVYDLYGVCNHMGNVMGGHYTAFVRNANNEWVHYNDTSVEIIMNPNMIITPSAYCLFYRKKIPNNNINE